MSDRTDLAEALGYRVETHDGRIGSVAAVLPRAGDAGVLLVRSGLMSCRVDPVLFSQVERVDPVRRSVVLRDVRRSGDTRRRALVRA